MHPQTHPANPFTVLFTWPVAERLREHLERRLADHPSVQLLFFGSIQLDKPGTSRPDEPTLLELAPRADVLVGWRPSPELLAAAERLTVFINPGAGVQHLIEPFRELNRTRQVRLVNGHGNSVFAAQHAVALLLALTNRIIPHHNWMVEGRWRTGDRDAASLPLRERSVGLLGYGAINRKVHRFLAGFDVPFAALRRDWAGDDGPFPTALERFSSATWPDFLDAIDTLVVAVPQTAETLGLVDGAALRRLGPSGLLVTVARGPVVDEADLFGALGDGTIAGAAIDVWYDYQPEPDAAGRRHPFTLPFHTLDNVVLSPHRAASPMGDLERWDEVIENIRRATEGRTDLLNLVDLDRGY